MQNRMPRTPEPELMDDPEEARVYARADFSEVNARFVRDLLDFLEKFKPLCTLDLGCGPADIPLRLHQERPSWPIYALDAAEAMLRLAREQLAARGIAGQVHLVLAAAQRLPVRSGMANLIISNSLLHHLPDPLALWQEVRRIAAPGARVFIRDLMRPMDENTARQIVREHASAEPPLLQEEFYRSLLSAFTPAEVRSQLAEADLTRLNVYPASDRHLDIAGVLA